VYGFEVGVPIPQSVDVTLMKNKERMEKRDKPALLDVCIGHYFGTLFLKLNI
jgi:hypothetical protein